MVAVVVVATHHLLGEQEQKEKKTEIRAKNGVDKDMCMYLIAGRPRSLYFLSVVHPKA